MKSKRVGACDRGDVTDEQRDRTRPHDRDGAMMTRTCMIGLLLLLGAPSMEAAAASRSLIGDGVIQLKTGTLIYVIGEDGLNHSLRDRHSGKDYLQSLLSKTGADLATRVANGGFACPELEFGV